MFTLYKQEGRARLGAIQTAHGEIKTPAFMNVATQAAIKGGLSSIDLKEIGAQVALSNTYHLHLRPGEEAIKTLGGLHRFMRWEGPILTDSGGFQVFSLSKLRRIKEEGVHFNAHTDGRKIFMGPEESMAIQWALGSDIAMAFDECVENPSPYDYTSDSCDRTVRWLKRCVQVLNALQQREDTVTPTQVLWGINQGGTFDDLRVRHMQEIAALDLPGYAIGGLAVGEPVEVMYHIIETVEPHMPKEKPRYLMGVGTPGNIIEAVYRGIDIFDCVMPARNARHGHLFTSAGVINLNNAKYILDEHPIDLQCGCPVCQNFSRAYLRHLLKSGEMLGMRLCVMHNLYFYNHLMQKIREAISEGTFAHFRLEYAALFDRRI